MESPQQVSVRDPVCGMTVAVNRETPSAVFGQQTFFFCAPGCQARFLAAPERYTRPSKPKPPRAIQQLLREASIVAVVLVLAIVVVALARGKKEEPPPVVAGSSIVGSAAGQDQAVDNGAGSVIVSATFERAASTDREALFTVSLNTHTINLLDFDPAAQIVLRTADGQEQSVETASQSGERSSHHQNFRVGFARPASGNVTLVVRNVSGIAERLLTLKL